MDSSLPSAPAADPRIGSVLSERYRIVRRIGEGGMGVVYEGEHLGIKRRVAIKMLHPEYSKQFEIVERFRREAIAATAIHHPHIVEVFDMGEASDGAAYIVLEFLEGRDWADDLDKTGPQSLGKVARIMRQVCDGLQAAHDKGIVHRDLKPENVFLARHGSNVEHVKLVDFGISKMLEPDGEGEGKPKSAVLTRTGAAMGTPYTMAPEQMQGARDVDHRADLWSLGVMMFRALTDTYPFEGDTFPMLAVAVLTGEPAPLSNYRDDLPPQIQDLVSRLLDKRKEHRLASARELRAALAPFEGEDTRVSLLARSATIPLGTAVASPSSDPPAQVADAPRVSAPSATPAPPSRAVTGPIAPPDATQLPSVSSTTKLPSETSIAVPVSSGPSMVTVALLTVALLGLGAGGALYLGGRDAASTNEATPAAALATAPVEAPPPSIPSTVPAGETVRVQITASPAEAELLLDGRPLINPFDGDLPESTELHTLEVRAEGYEPHTRSISLSFAQRITVALEPSELGAARPSTGRTVRDGTRAGSTTYGEPAHTEAAHTEAAHTEAAHTEAVHTEAAHTEPEATHEAPAPETGTRPGLRSPFGG